MRQGCICEIAAITCATWSFGQKRASRVSSANLAFITNSAPSANFVSSLNISCLYMLASLSTTPEEAIESE